MARAVVIGAGLAGLSAGIRLAEKGYSVELYEQSGHAGGRARSFFDAKLQCRIDNGNHLMLSGNHATLDYLQLVGGLNELHIADKAQFHFFDLDTGERWCVDLNRGPVPLWMLYKNRRVPGTTMADYLSGLKLISAGNRTIADLFAEQGQIYRRFWEPFSIAVLNTAPDEAVARLLTPVIRETLAKGAGSSRPMIAKRGLSETFVEPALRYLAANNAKILFNQRIDKLNFDRARLTSITTIDGDIEIAKDDVAVLAVPAWSAQQLLDDIKVPQAHQPIVNVHYKLSGNLAIRDDLPQIIGMIGSHGHWLFRRGPILSVTISAAEKLAALPADEIAVKIWPEVTASLRLGKIEMPDFRIIKERRATFAATAAGLLNRPTTATGWRNLALAGDWTDTGLPATIEGAIRSGEKAAQYLHK